MPAVVTNKKLYIYELTANNRISSEVTEEYLKGLKNSIIHTPKLIDLDLNKEGENPFVLSEDTLSEFNQMLLGS